VIDNDGRSQTDIERLKTKGVYAVSVHSVELIYYHPEIQRCVVEAHAAVTGDDAATQLVTAANAVIASMTPAHVQRLSARVVENQLREEISSKMPRQEDIQAKPPINILIDVAAVVTTEANRFQTALATNDSATIISRYPVRETPALDKIAKALEVISKRCITCLHEQTFDRWAVGLNRSASAAPCQDRTQTR